MKKLMCFIFIVSAFAGTVLSQTLYVPSGGIGTSTNGNVGIGTSTPQLTFEIVGWGQAIRSTTPSSYSTFRLYNDQNNALRALEIAYSGSSYPGSLLNGSPTGESGSIATTGAFPLSLGTANTTRMTILSNGYIGIGTVSPSTKLHVNGALRIDGASGGSIGSGNGSRIELSTGGSTSIEENWGINLIGNDGSPVKIRNAALLVGYTSSSAGWGTGGNLLVQGNVGIGTPSPTTNLHIGNSNGGGLRIGAVNDPGNTAVASGVQTAQYNLDFSGYRDITTDQIGARIAALRFNAYVNNYAGIQNVGLAFYTNPYGTTAGAGGLVERMRIDPFGNVGIGTGANALDDKLAVKGRVHANEVKVDLNVPGPDYIFEKDYKLASLEEIKNYIDQNKHLPEVPSAKEMEKNGVQLGEMNMLLLKKIEELTLYVIELKMRDEAQQKEIELLKTKK